MISGWTLLFVVGYVFTLGLWDKYRNGRPEWVGLVMMVTWPFVLGQIAGNWMKTVEFKLYGRFPGVEWEEAPNAATD